MKELYISHEKALNIMLSMYIGYKCPICKLDYSSTEIIDERNPKVLLKDENGICLCCEQCWPKTGK